MAMGAPLDACITLSLVCSTAAAVANTLFSIKDEGELGPLSYLSRQDELKHISTYGFQNLIQVKVTSGYEVT